MEWKKHEFPKHPQTVQNRRKGPDCLGVRNRVGNGQVEEVVEGNSVTNLEFGLVVGKVVQGFQYENFEHEKDVEGRATGVGESFFFADFGEVGPKDFPIDERVEFRKKVVDLVDFVEMAFEVEEGELAHAESKIGENTKKRYF